MTVALVWAQDRAGAIGKQNGIPWRVPEDLAHFKKATDGGAVIMGRRTWESLPAKVRPLPGRRNIVVSRNGAYAAPGADVTTDLGSALDLVAGTAAVIGGGEIYAAAMEFATHLRVTEIDVRVHAADAFAPVIDPEAWEASSTGDWLSSSTGTLYRFVDYARR